MPDNETIFFNALRKVAGVEFLMAKSLEIPAVVGLVSATKRIPRGERLIVDGTRGEVIVGPDEETVKRYELEQRRHQEVSRQLLQRAA